MATNTGRVLQQTSTSQTVLRAGDTRVKHGDIMSATRDWGVTGPQGREMIGQPYVHPKYITSPRVEIHVIPARCMWNDEQYLSYCDHKAAIAIDAKGHRFIPNGTQSKYTDKHGIESKSLIQAKWQIGNRTIQWLKSHHEMLHTKYQRWYRAATLPT